MTEVVMRWNQHKIRALVSDNGCQIMVRDVLVALGWTDKRARYTLKKPLRRHIQTHRFKGQGGSPSHVLDPCLIVKLLFPELRRQLCPGEIYCFLAKHKENFYKFGRTANWEERKKGYTGLSEIGKVLMVIPVQNIRSAERKLLTFARRTMITRIGAEWFESTVGLECVQSNLKQFLENVTLCDGTELDDFTRFLLNYKNLAQLETVVQNATKN